MKNYQAECHNANAPFRKRHGADEKRERERDPENENDVFPLTDPRVAAAIKRISGGLSAARRDAEVVAEAGRDRGKNRDRENDGIRLCTGHPAVRVQF